ncbi:hypothetical protein AK812_SmicGene28539 [Symbiodinium microadriaticum]|uniref:Uncharacterized protein n=1 Tax=Symbiodinium microadriaticum TaxID=2951 RepID=A0A1Q9D421_SYMMI|nr:hypothetical protein AK812_SmicGene28539 [Symbiodinium microadriaticum]
MFAYLKDRKFEDPEAWASPSAMIGRREANRGYVTNGAHMLRTNPGYQILAQVNSTANLLTLLVEPSSSQRLLKIVLPTPHSKAPLQPQQAPAEFIPRQMPSQVQNFVSHGPNGPEVPS